MRTATRIIATMLVMAGVFTSSASAKESTPTPVPLRPNVRIYLGSLYPQTSIDQYISAYVGHNAWRQSTNDALLFLQHGAIRLQLVRGEKIVYADVNYGTNESPVTRHISWNVRRPLPLAKLLIDENGDSYVTPLSSVAIGIYNPRRPRPTSEVK